MGINQSIAIDMLSTPALHPNTKTKNFYHAPNIFAVISLASRQLEAAQAKAAGYPPCGQTISEMAIRLFMGWPAHRA
jgi:hypothetical protein